MYLHTPVYEHVIVRN